MSIQKKFEQISRQLVKHKQGHVLVFWGRLKTAQKKNFLTQMQQWDLSEIPHWIRVVRKPSRRKRIGGRLTPAQSYSPVPTNARQKRKYAKAIELGRQQARRLELARTLKAAGEWLIAQPEPERQQCGDELLSEAAEIYQTIGLSKEDGEQ